MKDKIYFEKGEFFGMPNYPDEPDFAKLKKDHVYKDYKFYTGFKDSDIQKQHDDDIQACIAAKKRIKNPECLQGKLPVLKSKRDGKWYYLDNRTHELKDGDIFDLMPWFYFKEFGENLILVDGRV